jgi:mutator protein MutT
MKLVPVGLCLFYRRLPDALEVWVQRREDDGIYHGMLEFPGGGIEPGETPLTATVREVLEEVGITIDPEQAQFMGIYNNELPGRNILLYIYLYPDDGQLQTKGSWLRIEGEALSSPYLNQIPAPNHRIIDDLYRHFYK